MPENFLQFKNVCTVLNGMLSERMPESMRTASYVFNTCHAPVFFDAPMPALFLFSTYSISSTIALPAIKTINSVAKNVDKLIIGVNSGIFLSPLSRQNFLMIIHDIEHLKRFVAVFSKCVHAERFRNYRRFHRRQFKRDRFAAVIDYPQLYPPFPRKFPRRSRPSLFRLARL